MESEESYRLALEVEEIMWVAWNKGETLNSLTGLTSLTSEQEELLFDKVSDTNSIPNFFAALQTDND